MLVESLASKLGCLKGDFVDGTPFQAAEGAQPPAEVFGELLAARGFSAAGSETLISGVTGEVLHADVFIGCGVFSPLCSVFSSTPPPDPPPAQTNVLPAPTAPSERHV